MLFLYLQNTKQTKVTLSTKQTIVWKKRWFRVWEGCVSVSERVWKWRLLICLSVCEWAEKESWRLGGNVNEYVGSLLY